MARSRSLFCCALVLLLVCFFLSTPFYAIASTSQGVVDSGEVDDDVAVEDRGSGIVADSFQDLSEIDLQPAAGVDTVYLFPNNADKSTPAGEVMEVIAGVSNKGELPLKVSSVSGSLHLLYDHRYKIQNFSAVEYRNSIVPPSVQASFPYAFTVSKYLQAGTFALVASILYEVDGQPHRSVFYNGTIEVVDAGGFLSGETLFLVTLGVGLLGLLGMWVYGQIQKLSKTRRTKKVETGTRSVEAVNNEWLQGTSFTQKTSKSIAQPTKSKKKK